MLRQLTTQALGAAALVTLMPCAQAQTPASSPAAAPAAAPILLAAGSLRQAMTEVLAAWQEAGGVPVEAQYGPSGTLRKEIEAGRAADVFASAAPEHTDALARQGLFGAGQVFAHNDLCIVGTPAAQLRADALPAALARPELRLATSTPGSDPMGDYTWQFFRKLDARQPGLFAILDAKALKLSGATAVAPESTLPYIAAFREDRADAYIMYCTNAVLTQQAVPALSVLRIPDELNVRSAYAIAARKGSGEGERLLRFVLGAPARAILRKYGFQ